MPVPMSKHKAEVCAGLSPAGQRAFPYIEFDDDEELLAEIRKHPIGLFFILLTGGFISAVIFLAPLLLATNLDSIGGDSFGSTDLARTVLLILGFVLFVLSLAATYVSAFIYRSSVVFVTNEKIAEVTYLSLFNRRVKQLGIGNVEDATVLQKGILTRLFNYGSLVIETAGEMANPAFTYVPKPNEYSQLIIQAHEAYVQKYGN